MKYIGELLEHINRLHGISEPCSKFYAAQITKVIEYLHKHCSIIHRDIKPENILLSNNWHIVLCDFGCATILESPNTTVTVKKVGWVGTPEYMAPEMIIESTVSFAYDYWSLGCVIYQFYTGRTPFKSESDFITLKKIRDRNPIYFPIFFPEDTKDLILKLLSYNSTQRLLFAETFQSHPFFNATNFNEFENTPAPPLHGSDYFIPKM